MTGAEFVVHAFKFQNIKYYYIMRAFNLRVSRKTLAKSIGVLMRLSSDLVECVYRRVFFLSLIIN